MQRTLRIMPQFCWFSATFWWSMLNLLGCKMSPWGNFCFKLCVINHDHNADVPQCVYGSCKHSCCIPECFSSLKWAWCLSWGVGGELAWCMWESFFSFQLQVCLSGHGNGRFTNAAQINGEETPKIRHQKQHLLDWRVFWEVLRVKSFMKQLRQVSMMKESRREDSVEAETSMANNHFLVAWHYV